MLLMGYNTLREQALRKRLAKDITYDRHKGILHHWKGDSDFSEEDRPRSRNKIIPEERNEKILDRFPWMKDRA